MMSLNDLLISFKVVMLVKLVMGYLHVQEESILNPTRYDQ